MKIALAGAESNEALKVLQTIQAPSILMTQMYLQKKSTEKVLELLEAYKKMGCWIIIDSGAFTFLSKYAIIRRDTTPEEFKRDYRLHRFVNEEWQNDPVESQKRFDKEFDTYFNKWLNSLDMYYEYADMIAEIDLDTLVGIDEMWELRSKYEKYKDKICYTPHMGINRPANERTSEEHKYLQDVLNYGITYMGIGNIPYKIIENFFISFPEIKEKKIKVHGWAQTNWQAIQRLPYFSIDSSTWLSANKFGVTFEFKQGWSRMKSHDHTQKEIFRNTCKIECEENNIDFENFKNDKPFESLQWSALQWSRMAEYYEQDISKAYWLSEDEISCAIQERREEAGMNNLIIRDTQEGNIFTDERLKINRICNSCEIADKCQNFKEGATCIFQTAGLTAGNTSKDLMKAVIDLQMGRVTHAVFSERVKGGSIDGNVTKEMQVLGRLIKDYDFMNQDGTGIHITATGEESVGVLERIFGGGGKKKPAEIIEAETVDYEEVKNE